MEYLNNVLIQLLAAGGGGAAVFYLFVKKFGERWLEGVFAQKMRNLEHAQNESLAYLKIRLDSHLSGAIKIQEKELQLLPELWEKVHSLLGHIIWLNAPIRNIPNIDDISPQSLEEFVQGLLWSGTQKRELIEAPQGTKVAMYSRVASLYERSEAMAAYSNFIKCMSLNKIFLSEELCKKLVNFRDESWKCLHLNKMGMENFGSGGLESSRALLKDVLEPLGLEIENAIGERIREHSTLPLRR